MSAARRAHVSPARVGSERARGCGRTRPRPARSSATIGGRRGELQVRGCGIIGITTRDTERAVAAELYEGLLMLQHRGQDSAGMVTYDGSRFREKKDNGLVKDVFEKSSMKYLEGHIGLGHVRYPTAGGLSATEAQPFFVNQPLGIYLIHNGNLTNADYLREKELNNRHLRTGSDSEILLNVFAEDLSKEISSNPNKDKDKQLFDAVTETMGKVKGAYSIISLINGQGMFAFRDPHGIRPLVLGQRQNANGQDEWCVASEDAAFGPLGFSIVRDVNPGEAILITDEGKMISRQCVKGAISPCIFEYIYLARPDSQINGISVYEFQLELGRRLAKRINERGWEIDTIVPVPDGSRPSAIEVASALDLPYREGLVKNRYVGRTFIMPDQRTRELSVRRKLNAMRSVFNGKSVLLIDDSIVRGTTMNQIVKMCRDAGAVKVYLASAAPPVRYPNVYGVDMPSRKEFVADNKTEEEICATLGADGLIYQTVDDLLQAGLGMNAQIPRFDASCFNGDYVTGDIDDKYLERLEAAGRGKGKTGATAPAR
ncbi:Glutamine amidotransferase type 2 domain [Ostreococcus tauri]|uniref:Amidophosphoribosyltransferase n=2 Tax=Ostreococcus tauri TaxID=70448 RepID=A0A090MAL1_OSTTA|nr:Glutamine amidotransferase type 2 domain [Ostreococcus tauri]CEF99762.1 Glutamine amidotransferase type 2 domain [Ostreococcus tauri]|eukprot:XP_003082174.2 Glutamine amidotransferase type 2 domain [Ostreococcus tauri]